MDNMLSVLENYMLDNPDDIAKGIADDFLAVGIKAKIPPTRCRELYEQVRENLIIHTSDRR